MRNLAEETLKYVEDIRAITDTGDDGVYAEIDPETGDLLIGAGGIIRIPRSEQLIDDKLKEAATADGKTASH